MPRIRLVQDPKKKKINQLHVARAPGEEIEAMDVRCEPLCSQAPGFFGCLVHTCPLGSFIKNLHVLMGVQQNTERVAHNNAIPAPAVMQCCTNELALQEHAAKLVMAPSNCT